MGLDISAYEVATKAEGSEDEDDFVLYTFGWPQEDGLAEGAYKVSGARHGFWAGSYFGYNAWREELARLVGTTPDKVWKSKDTSGPFVRLINFSDCEGFIGPESSTILAKEFDDWRSRAVEYANRLTNRSPLTSRTTGEWFLAKYEDWSKAFHVAAGRGVVVFH